MNLTFQRSYSRNVAHDYSYRTHEWVLYKTEYYLRLELSYSVITYLSWKNAQITNYISPTDINVYFKQS